MAEEITLGGTPHDLDNFLDRSLQAYNVRYKPDLKQKLKEAEQSDQEYGVFVKDRLVGTSKIRQEVTDNNFELTGTKIGERIEDFVKNQDMEIPESIAKWRAANKGYDMETSVSDLDDALAALGAQKIELKPVDKLEKVKQTAKQANEKAGNYNQLASLIIAGVAISGLVMAAARRYL